MKRNQANKTEAAKNATRRHEEEAEAGVGGALCGAAMGAVAGPPGAVAGAVIGGMIAAVVAGVVAKENAQCAADGRELDEEIGVTGGELGAPNLDHPPAKRGVYSMASMGVSSPAGSSPAEGPMQPPEG